MTSDLRWLQQYEPGVPATIAVPEHTIQQLLIDAAARYPTHTAVRMVLRYLPLGLKVQARLSYAELNRLSDRFAAALAGLGVLKGERVAIMLPNLPQQVIAYFGVLKVGAIVVNTNPTYPALELEPLLRDTGVTTIITLSGLFERVRELQPKTAIIRVILTDIPDMVGRLFRRSVAAQVRAGGMMKAVSPQPGVYFMQELLAHSVDPAPATVFDAADSAVFQFTGGTSGLPKAAELTHRNVVANVAQTSAWVPSLRPGAEKFLLALPAFHVYGMTVGMLVCLNLGGELVLTPDPRNTLLILETIARERITLYPGVPTMYIALLNHARAGEFNLRSLRVCLSGGAPLPLEVAQRFEAVTGGKLVEGYGMSESSPLTVGNPVFGQTRTGTVGLPFPSTEVVIVALEADAQGVHAPVATGEAGELLVRGPQVMKGYFNNPEETAATIDADGWLHTGDIAVIDADGYITIVDRKKDLIIAGGYNIVPREVEEALFKHPKILEAAVVGVPDAKRGETVKACIVLKSGESATPEEVRAFCKAHLAPYKVPTVIEFCHELPKTQVGKVLRRQLIAQAASQ
ncbi:MAG: long-chain fatty acid--CoA ligase [Caldilineaceae bacterium]|jgi:long-chain acyl-CoA synthetase|nr:long-chain fatty acid--CoA ligase [Caldilineaceae bacterium]